MKAMAPIASTISMSHVQEVSDSARARELYKYYQPNPDTTGDSLKSIPDEPSSLEDPEPTPHVKSNITSSKISSPDTALTSFAQLVAWRLGVERAMISVIDHETQYFIAESTKTLDLFDGGSHQPGDELWMGCGSVSKAGRLCERTIEVPPAAPGKYPAFIVSDLSKDGRFNSLPFVTGAPFLKFYAGTPLITKRGIAIGSLFVVDTHPRESIEKSLTEGDIHFMGTMAKTIMRHLEMNRDVEERRRGMKMSRGLASFVEGRSQLSEDDMDDDFAMGNEEGEKVAGQFQTPTNTISEKEASVTPSEIDQKEKEYSNEMLQTQEAIMSSNQSTGTHPSRPVSFALSDSSNPLSSYVRPTDHAGIVSSPPESETSAMQNLFSRAANIIRESFEVYGAVLYDAQKGFGSEYTQESDQSSEPVPTEISQKGPASISRGSASLDTDYQDFAPISNSNATSERYGKGNVRKSIGSDKTVDILGFSTECASSIHGDPIPGPNVFSAFDERSLHLLLRRYPRGKLWNLDEDGVISSSDEDTQGQANKPNQGKEETRKRSRGAGEARFLLKHFPAVRQLVFVPLWDAARSRWLSGCFAWSNEPTRVLSKQVELSFLTAFGNSVMAECSRIDTEIADQKKGDFIGSISHELRSPLHGILASAEFLSDEISEGFAKSLVETIDSCGRTLLDTINHILDYSKINHFEKNLRRSRRGGNRPQPSSRVNSLSALAAKSSGLPMINLYADVDISVICEEVVEGVFAGHVFQNLTASNFDHIVSDPRARSVSIPPLDGHGDLTAASQVAVILDMDMGNYSFTTQPGAFKRVVMNLLGNSLKYTSKGYVRIKLETLPMEDLQQPGSSETIARSCIILTVSDTGKGISSEFLRSKLFTPFAQENSLSSGTGLGLSIVRSIVTLLEGEIQINSRVGVGTEVKITLPLLREMPKTGESSISGSGSAATARSSNSIVRDVDESISLLRSQAGKNVYLHGFEEADDAVISQTAQLFKASIIKYLENWYGFRVTSEKDSAEIIIANECDMATASFLARPRPGRRSGPSVIVVRSHSHNERGKPPSSGNVSFVAKPIGPLKLARVILQSLSVHPSLTPGLTPGGSTKSLETNDLSHIFEDVSLSPHGGEVLDNSRMAAGSDNARKALESPAPSSFEKTQEFPFPSLDDDRPPLAEKAKTMFGDKEALKSTTLGTIARTRRTSLILTNIEKSATEHQEEPIMSSHIRSASSNNNLPAAPSTLPSPRLLLVDDNKINLRLLRTYMRKRAYSCIDEAENGLEAVNKVKEREEGYDIIFMDISMPVLDGFGATRQIREIERARQEKAGGTLVPALIIALTGLASSRDQSEAFRVGVDLFLTKPVSFKEVGKMLDNWVSNREKDSEEADETNDENEKDAPTNEKRAQHG